MILIRTRYIRTLSVNDNEDEINYHKNNYDNGNNAFTIIIDYHYIIITIITAINIIIIIILL